jgi:hypothetical protein
MIDLVALNIGNLFLQTLEGVWDSCEKLFHFLVSLKGSSLQKTLTQSTRYLLTESFGIEIAFDITNAVRVK